ncbi:hydrogenase formation protein HypD [candidate division WOR-3 bacterium]|nr:hydrogenase formation protein HypD [candidate division WOR-3 bacterium]
MKYIDEFRDKKICQKLSEEIRRIARNTKREVVLMEVCGTHTTAIFRSGIRSLMPDNIRLLSGPGCPVCVTPNRYLDRAIAYSRLPDVIICTFGDMIKVPGSSSSLEKEKSDGADIRIVYSPLESIKISKENPNKLVIFLGVGFETTAPLVASTILSSKEEGLTNLFILSAHKLIPPAMMALLDSKDIAIDGFICPGHVSTIIGIEPYLPIVEKYGIPSVIIGFEPIDILKGILMLIKQIVNGVQPKVEIQYKRAVREEGNPTAQSLMNKIFKKGDTEWRGVGIIPESGLFIREEYSVYDAERNIEVCVEETKEHPDCICGEILRGVKIPSECSMFRKVCTPLNPVGPCMVSSEGTCAAYYRYGKE